MKATKRARTEAFGVDEQGNAPSTCHSVQFHVCIYALRRQVARSLAPAGVPFKKRTYILTHVKGFGTRQLVETLGTPPLATFDSFAWRL